MKNRILSTLKICFMVLTGNVFIEQAYGEDYMPFSYYAQKWEEAKNGQYDHPEDSTSGRDMIIYELGNARNPEAVPLLKSTLLEDLYACVRAEAAKSLGKIGDVSAIPALKKSLRTDRNERVRLYSACALVMLDDFSKEVLDKLLSIARGKNIDKWSYKGFLKNHGGETDSDLAEKNHNYMQIEALKYLMLIPNNEALAVLEEQEKSSNAEIAEIAKTTRVKWLAKNKAKK